MFNVKLSQPLEIFTQDGVKVATAERLSIRGASSVGEQEDTVACFITASWGLRVEEAGEQLRPRTLGAGGSFPTFPNPKRQFVVGQDEMKGKSVERLLILIGEVQDA